MSWRSPTLTLIPCKSQSQPQWTTLNLQQRKGFNQLISLVYLTADVTAKISRHSKMRKLISGVSHMGAPAVKMTLTQMVRVASWATTPQVNLLRGTSSTSINTVVVAEINTSLRVATETNRWGTPIMYTWLLHLVSIMITMIEGNICICKVNSLNG